MVVVVPMDGSCSVCMVVAMDSSVVHVKDSARDWQCCAHTRSSNDPPGSGTQTLRQCTRASSSLDAARGPSQAATGNWFDWSSALPPTWNSSSQSAPPASSSHNRVRSPVISEYIMQWSERWSDVWVTQHLITHTAPYQTDSGVPQCAQMTAEHTK